MNIIRGINALPRGQDGIVDLPTYPAAANDEVALVLTAEDLRFITSEPWFQYELDTALKRVRAQAKLANPPVQVARPSKRRAKPSKKAVSKNRNTEKKTSRQKH